MSVVFPTVSVIIPCYNQGIYLDEAVGSVLAQTYQDFEIIIINDGSDDPESVEILTTYQWQKTRIIHTENQGVSIARNTAIASAKGQYILPLDADDKIGKTYLDKAVKLLEKNDNLGIVYCEAEFFGSCQGKWQLERYSFPEILLENVIFCSGFFRKSDWQTVGGYNPNMVDGWEDYDFWLSIIELGREVYQIPETLFFYHQKEVSRSTLMNVRRSIKAHVKIFKNHQSLYLENLDILFITIFNNKISNNELKYKINDYQHQIENYQSQILDFNHQVQDFLSQRDRAIERINQLENHEKELETDLKKTQEDFVNSQKEVSHLALQIQEMEKSKFWQLRNVWVELKRVLRLTQTIGKL